MKRFLVGFILLLSGFVLLSAYTIQVSPGVGYDVEVLSNEGGVVRLQFNIRSFDVEQFQINGEIFDHIILSHEAYHRDVGFPEIPTLRRSVIIEDIGEVSVKVISEEYEDIPMVHRIIPSRGNIQRSEDPSDIPYTFEGYTKEGFYPEYPLKSYEPFILRDYRGVNVEVNPFLFDPVNNVLRVYSKVVVEVSVDQGSGINEISRADLPFKVDESYFSIYKDVFLNFDTGRYTPIPEPGRMFIITYDAFHTNAEPLLEWKLQKGTECYLVDFSTIGTTAAHLSNYLDSLYNTADKVTYVLLVGDVAQIPTLSGTYSSSINTDTRYALVDGSDLYADFFISRFSVTSAAQVSTQVAKSLHYDKDIQNYTSGTSWLGKGVGIGGDDTGGTGYADWERVEMLRDSLMNIAGYTEVDQIYHSSATASQVTTALNAGRGIINYIGHGSGTSWSTTGFNVSNVHALNNPWMLPFIEDVACQNGNYGMTECFGEAWLRAGDATNPDGAIAYHGASTNASWVPPCDMQSHMIHLLVREDKQTFGGLFFGGEMKALDLYPGTGGQGHKIVEQYNILGDCELMARTAPQQTLTVNHQGTIFLGNTTYQVQVVGVENAKCAIYHDGTIYGVAYTDAGGNATVTLDPAPTTPMDLLLTITGLNLETYQDTVSAIPASGAYITFVGMSGMTGGHNNGQINAGCDYYMKNRCANVGNNNASGVYGLVSTSDPYVTVNDDSVYFGSVNIGDTIESSNELYLSFNDNIQDNYAASLTIEYHDADDTVWTNNFSLIVNAPVISLWTMMGPAEVLAGDNFYMWPKLENEGSGTAYNLDLVIRTDDSYGSVTDSTESMASILPGDISWHDSAFQVTISASTPEPYFMDFELEVQMSGGYSYFDTITVGIGSVVFSEDFESGDTAWTYTGSTSWHLTEHDAHSVTHSMYCGQEGTWEYVNSLTNSRTMSPQFTVGAGAVMSFWHRYDIETSWDGAQMQMTTNGGSTWTTIDPDEGYTGASNYGYGGYNTGDPLWTGHDHTVWEEQHHTFTISGDINVCWRFGSDGSVTEEGYYFDDVLVGVESGFLGVEEELTGPVVPGGYQFALHRAYPNPVRGRAMIFYSVGTEAPVRLIIYDVTGREVSTLVNQVQTAGNYKIEWDGRDNHGSMVSSGTYFYRMTAGEYSAGEKLVVVR